MDIFRPVRTARCTQRFGESSACARLTLDGGLVFPTKVVTKINMLCPSGYTSFYERIGLQGHDGQDNATYYREPCFFPVISKYTWYAVTEKDQAGGLGVDVISNEKNENGLRVKFRFWHLAEQAIHDKQPIRPGDLLGYCDSTGSSSGNHLHWSMKECINEWGDAANEWNGYRGAIDFTQNYTDEFILDTLGRKEKLDWQQIIQQLLNAWK